ncbi:MAG: DUF5719 family protein [Chloroflexota bacterium]
MNEAHTTHSQSLSAADLALGSPAAPQALPGSWRYSGAQAQARARVRHIDWSLLLAAVAAAVAGLVALYWSYSNHLVLVYSDAGSHLNIARRVLDSRTPSIAQLGTVWLPVPHILMQPFIQNDFLWHTGLAGSIVGFACFEIAAVSLFLSVRLIVRHEIAAWIGMAVFITNPNVLYVQTTALTEPVLLMSMTASGYFVLRWSKRESQADLLTAGLLAMVAVGSRYDGWFFVIVCGALVAIISYLRWHDRDRAEGTTMAFLAWPVYAMFIWFFYNWLIFGDPLAFQHGQFSAQAQQNSLQLAGHLPTKGNLPLSVVTYGWTALYNLGTIVTVLALAGLLAYIVHTKMRVNSLIPYAFLSGFPFNVLALWLGQTVIWTPHGNPPLYFNMRYGLMVLPGAALFVGFLADYVMLRAWRILVGVGFAALLTIQGLLWVPNWPFSVVTVADGLLGLSQRGATLHAATYLRDHYTGGGILYDDSLSGFITQAQLNMREYILNGTTWNKALKDPVPYAEWVVMQPTRSIERVAAALIGNPEFASHYTLWYTAEGYFVFHRNPVPPVGGNRSATTTTGTQFYIAGGESSARTHAAIRLDNPTPRAASVAITFYYPNGDARTRMVDVGPASRRQLSVVSLDPKAKTYGLLVHASLPITVSLAIQRSGTGGDSLQVSQGLAKHWVLSESASGAAASESFYLLNPEPEARARVTLHLRPRKGKPSSRRLIVGPHSISRIALPPNEGITVDVQSNLPIAADRMVRLSAKGYRRMLSPTPAAGRLSARAGTGRGARTYVTLYTATCSAISAAVGEHTPTAGLLAAQCRDGRAEPSFLRAGNIVKEHMP